MPRDCPGSGGSDLKQDQGTATLSGSTEHLVKSNKVEIQHWYRFRADRTEKA
jgi:hypothetical protein